MKYTIYQIINTINSKIYIGKHQTNDIDDGYMGSGKNLKRAIKKYGIENFVKEVVYVFDSEEEMNYKEAELVTEEFCLREDTYNICVGGQGGFSHINLDENFRKNKNKKARRVTDSILKIKYGVENPSQIDFVKQKLSIKMKERWRDGKISLPPTPFLGKSHSLETKKKMSESKKGKFTGEKNSQYGTMWITNGNINKKVKCDDIIPDGWYKGRLK
jgi:group I intron endonuclease